MASGKRSGKGKIVEDRAKLTSWMHRGQGSRWGTDPAAFDPEYAAAFMEKMGRLYGEGRYFDLEVEGWENLPPSPVLLVSNHSGGTTIPDVWGFAMAWFRRFGVARVMHPLAHEMVFSIPQTGVPFSRLGVLRASPERAEQVLTTWKRDVMVMPGGDRDTWRPWTERYKVRFAGRRGYARLALRAGVPVVPMANAGAHAGLIVLSDGAALARRLKLQRIARASVWPLHLSLPWGLAFGPVPHLPPPGKLRYKIGPAILPVGPPTAEPDEAAVDALDEQVRAAVQGLLDRLEAEEEPLHRRVMRWRPRRG